MKSVTAKVFFSHFSDPACFQCQFCVIFEKSSRHFVLHSLVYFLCRCWFVCGQVFGGAGVALMENDEGGGEGNRYNYQKSHQRSENLFYQMQQIQTKDTIIRNLTKDQKISVYHCYTTNSSIRHN